MHQQLKITFIIISVFFLSATLANAGEKQQENLGKSPVMLEKTTITATKTEIKTKEVPASVNIVTIDEIQLTSGTDDYYNAIRNVAGVSIKREGFQNALLVRGMTPSILTNGRDMNPFVTSTSLITSSMNIGMGSIERIEVIKGPQAAIHGAKAVSGVVNVIKKKGDKENPYIELRSFFGTGDELSGGLSASGGYKNLSYFIDVSAADQDTYHTPQGKIPYMEYERKNLYGRLDYAISDDHNLSLDCTYNKSKNIQGGKGYYLSPNAWSNLYSYEPEYTGVFLNYDGKFSDTFSLYTNLGMGFNDFYMVYGRPNTAPIHFLNKENENRYKENSLQGEIKATINILPEDRLKGIVGLQFKNTNLDGTSEKTIGGIKQPFFNWKTSEDYWAPFAQIEFKPIPYMLLITGLRHNAYDTDGKKAHSTNPNLGISIFPFAETDYNWTTLWASYSEAFRMPTAAQRYLPGFLGGNADLKPEESSGWEVGIKQQISHWANIELSYFKTDYEDLIKLTMPGPGVWKFQNIGKAEYKGVEFITEIYPTEWLILHFAYTHMDRQDIEKDTKLYGQPEQVYKYGVSIPDFYGFGFSLWGENNCNYRISKNNVHPSEGDAIFNSKLRYKWQATKDVIIEPFISVENLTNQKIYTPGPESGITEGRAIHVGTNFKLYF